MIVGIIVIVFVSYAGDCMLNVSVVPAQTVWNWKTPLRGDRYSDYLNVHAQLVPLVQICPSVNTMPNFSVYFFVLFVMKTWRNLSCIRLDQRVSLWMDSPVVLLTELAMCVLQFNQKQLAL